MRHSSTTLAVLLLTLPSLRLLKAQEMSHEEEVVRNAYSKLSVLSSLYTVTHTGEDQLAGKQVDGPGFDRKLADSVPVFAISDVQTGPILSIASDPLGNYISVPHRGDRVLQGISTTSSHSDNGNQTAVTAAQFAWKLAQGQDPSSENLMLALPIANAIKLGAPEWSTVPVTYTRYASFTVDAKLQGSITGPHKAIFFFGNDAHGNEVVAFIDPFSGTQILWDAVNGKPYYPASILSSKLRETPVVANWIRTNEMPASSCEPTKREMCCSRGVCGISIEDLNRELSTPLPQPKKIGLEKF